ncbi:Glucose/arabinose dehydrogenase, beta-propeller fold [Spirosomataceae bacterium TFI 002]|nr:Glucose/arabinose dehydrogenase, beta-propeller fold [Spirosomataceae bacterium TFI 002]
MKNRFSKYLLLLAISGLIYGCLKPLADNNTIYTKPPMDTDPAAPSLSPMESMGKIYLPEGYSLELVASEPMIEEPIDIAWDADGKMYVAEFLTYMQDINGTNENEPWSRVSVLEDTNGDGKMDKKTVFIDSLLLPRLLLPLDDRVIIGETYSNNFWSYRDTDGDRVADEKVLIFENDKIFKGNLEHQSANLTWNIDNWLYLSKDPFRYKWKEGKLIIDTLLDAPTGQYGLTQDETGKMYYSRAGGEVVALGFQQHPIYGNLEMDGRWADDFEQPWPIIGTPDVQGGKIRLRPDNTLNKFTAVSGQEVFLGDRLPLYGDLFVPEPVGRLIRRAKISNVDGKIVLSNPYDKAEFMASTDPNFRPVRVATGPDGCMYVVDMYRGIIQEGNWTREGSFLRPEIERRNLDKNIGKGRIYRVVYKGVKPAKVEKMLSLSSKDLLPYLGHPNGWYRMTAQKLLVLRQDKTIVSDLLKTLRGNSKGNAKRDEGIKRLHALWTLEGLGQLSKSDIISKTKDSDSRVSCAAIRLCEQFLKDGDQNVFATIKSLKNHPNKDVLIQVVLTSKTYANRDEAKLLIQEIVDLNPENEVIAVSSDVVTSDVENLKVKHVLKHPNTKNSIIRGYETFKVLCASCHGKEGKGIKDLAPPLVGSPRIMGDDLELPVKILLNGLSGEVDGKDYGIMLSLKGYDDQWISDVITYVREEIGDGGKTVNSRIVSDVRKKYGDREQYWTLKELGQSK